MSLREMAGDADDVSRFLTRRESDVLSRTAEAAQEARDEAHQRQHETEQALFRAAIDASLAWHRSHETSHLLDDAAHEKVHGVEQTQVITALAAVARERTIHADAHEREHAGHQREHQLDKLAIDKAEHAADIRFDSANGYREQFMTAIASLASKDALDSLQNETDRRIDALGKTSQERYEQNRLSIVNLEKGDEQDKGRDSGRNGLYLAIIGGAGLLATILSIVIIIANVLTQSRP